MYRLNGVRRSSAPVNGATNGTRAWVKIGSDACDVGVPT